MVKKLFITDLDGTLMTDKKTISEKDIESLEGLRRKGVVTAVATGRSAHSFEKALSAIGFGVGQRSLPIDYVIFSTGAGLMSFPERKTLLNISLPWPDVQKISLYFDLLGVDHMIHKAIPDTRRFLYKCHGEPNPDFQTRLAFYKDDGFKITGGLPDNGSRATQVLAIVPPQASWPDMMKIRQDLSAYSVVRTTSPMDHRSLWIEVFHRDVSKSKTAAHLAGRLSIDCRDVISVGNDYNDEDLLAWTGKAYVVEAAADIFNGRYETVPSNNAGAVSAAALRSGWV